jgi:4-hydroxybenzoate polyprenyltransferase
MRIPKSSGFFDYIFLMRPTLLVPVWTILLIGYYRGLVHFGRGTMRFVFPEQFIYVFVIYSTLMGGVYIANQIADRETDRKNEKLFLLSAGVVPLWHAVLEMAFLFLIPLIFSFCIGRYYSILFGISLVLGILYSAPPVRAKGRPILDLLFNSVGYGMVNFLVGWAGAGPLGKAALIHAVPYCLAVGGVFVNTTIPDIAGDRADGAITTGVFLGEVRTAVLGFTLMVGAALASAIVRDLVCLASSLIALPFFAAAVLNRNRRWYLRSFRIGAPVLVAAAFFLFPYYLVLLVVTLLSMRVYYKSRFDFSYPSVMSER